jgi:hypothetical protein
MKHAIITLAALLPAPPAALHAALLRKLRIEWHALGSGAFQGGNPSGENK